MKIIIKLILLISLSFMPLLTSVFSVTWSDEPGTILNELRDPDVQTTAIDDSGDSGGILKSMKGLKNDSKGYIQWMAYIGLGLALLIIIYNGIILLMNLGDKSKLGIVKKRLISITVGVVLVVSAYIVLELVLSLIGNLKP